jgi:hypothetical protein
MRSTFLSIATLAALALSAPGLAADVATAEGKVYGAPFKSSHAVAYSDEKGYTMVIFSDKPLVPSDIVKDGVVGHFAESDYQSAKKAMTATLMIDGDGTASCFLVQLAGGAGGGNSCGLWEEGKFKLEHRDDKRVSGWVDWADDDESMKMKFDLPISGKAAGT